MDYSVYAIKSEKDGRIYVGMSSNVEKRLKEHNAEHVFSTKGWRPWTMLYREDGMNRSEARKREKELKSGYGKEFLKNL